MNRWFPFLFTTAAHVVLPISIWQQVGVDGLRDLYSSYYFAVFYLLCIIIPVLFFNLENEQWPLSDPKKVLTTTVPITLATALLGTATVTAIIMFAGWSFGVPLESWWDLLMLSLVLWTLMTQGPGHMRLTLQHFNLFNKFTKDERNPPNDTPEEPLPFASVLSVSAAWASCILLPLDWDTAYQVFPNAALIGAYVGFYIGSVITVAAAILRLVPAKEHRN